MTVSWAVAGTCTVTGTCLVMVTGTTSVMVCTSVLVTVMLARVLGFFNGKKQANGLRRVLTYRSWSARRWSP